MFGMCILNYSIANGKLFNPLTLAYVSYLTFFSIHKFTDFFLHVCEALLLKFSAEEAHRNSLWIILGENYCSELERWKRILQLAIVSGNMKTQTEDSKDDGDDDDGQIKSWVGGESWGGTERKTRTRIEYIVCTRKYNCLHSPKFLIALHVLLVKTDSCCGRAQIWASTSLKYPLSAVWVEKLKCFVNTINKNISLLVQWKKGILQNYLLLLTLPYSLNNAKN